jgi:hypothetical protein
MRKAAWKGFTAARDRFREIAESLGRELPGLRAAQQELVDRRAGPAYTVETPVVYNRALDDVEPGAEIKLILVADNPGRREQAAENRRYLVGPSGKLAEKFFRDNPALGLNFREHLIILNKTPIHTPRTAELGELGRLGGEPVASAIAESQRAMAALIAEFQRALSADQAVPVWIIGYSEMRRGGIFETFTETLREQYDPRKTRAKKPRRGAPPPGDGLFLYRHFSMNQFTIDLGRRAVPGEPAAEALRRIGAAYRERILGW